MSWCETECKNRDGGEGEERGLRKGERERIEIERKETKGN